MTQFAIFRDQLNELAAEKAEGSLADADFEQARSELQRRLLEEVDNTEAAAATSHGPSRKTAIALLLLLPILALLGYGMLGNPRALDPTQTVAPPPMTAEKVNDNPDLLASYAEAIAMANGKGLKGKPVDLAERALSIDTNHGHSLYLA